MTQVFSAILAIAAAAASPATEWVDDNRIKVSGSFDASDPDRLFRNGEKKLKEIATEVCKEAGKGKAKIEGEAMVEGISISP